MRRPAALPMAVLAGTLLALAGCGGTPDPLRVDRAYVRLPAVPGNPAAAYLTITGGAAPDRLLSVGSDAAQRAELHAAMTHGGAMTMAPLPGVDIPAGTAVALAPAGRHIMLFGLPSKTPAGIPLTLRFRSGTTLTATAPTIAAGDPVPE